MLELEIAHPDPTANRSRTITAVIDTGCTNSAIRRDVADALGLPIIGTAPVATASSGTDVVTRDVVLARLLVGRERFHALRQLAICPMSNEMLFGMDAMAGGVLTIDMVRGTWEWKIVRVLGL